MYIYNLIKKRHRFFPVNFAKFLRTAFYKTLSVAASADPLCTEIPLKL